MNPDDLLSVAQAAEELGVSRQRVSLLIKEGRLRAQQVGRSYVVRRRDLDAVRERKPGRPSRTKGNEP